MFNRKLSNIARLLFGKPDKDASGRFVKGNRYRIVTERDNCSVTQVFPDGSGDTRYTDGTRMSHYNRSRVVR